MRLPRGARTIRAGRCPGAAVALAVWLVLAGATASADEGKLIDVRVTFVSGRSIFLDRGNKDGLHAHDVVHFDLAGGDILEAELETVADSTARAEAPAGAALPEQGATGYVRVPTDRASSAAPAPAPAPPQRRAVPDHPPWERQITPAKPGEILLSPALGQPPSDRPLRVHGRLYGQLLNTLDRADGRDNSSTLARLGTDLSADNPFRQGGQLRFAGTLRRRLVILEDAPDHSDNEFRVDRLSYRWGGEQFRAFRVEAGRFLPSATPELGLLDGVEVLYRTPEAGRFGVSVGALPAPFPARATGDDIGATLSYRYTVGERRKLSAGLALHQSWHRGTRDRTLLLGTLDYAPYRAVSVHSSMWVDYYDSNDTIKGRGLELTQLQIYGSWLITKDHGLRASFMRIRWPELLREEFQTLSPDLIRRNRLTRTSISSWNRLGEHLRVDGRLDYWRDQNDDGTGGEVTVRLPDLVARANELSASLFYVPGTFSSGPGVRLGVRQGFGSATFAEIAYELSRQKLDRFDLGSDTLIEHAVTARVDVVWRAHWNLSVNVDYRFGDSQDSISTGVFLQYRF